MKRRLAYLELRRNLLQDEIEAQRNEIAELSRSLHKPLALIDAGRQAIHFMYDHRAILTGGIAVLFAFRRGKFLDVFHKGWRFSLLYPSLLAFGLRYLSSSAPAQSSDPRAKSDS